MSVIFVLLPLALLIAGIALGFFIWAVRNGQYDDMETPPLRILFDDEESPRQPGAAKARPGEAPTSTRRSGDGDAETEPDIDHLASPPRSVSP